jgi:hypothetical protein
MAGSERVERKNLKEFPSKNRKCRISEMSEKIQQICELKRHIKEFKGMPMSEI